MAVAFRDYYEILGVPRTASQEEIRRAFRKLALEHHPDVARDKANADARFKEINEANEVLSDPEKRRQYDALGARWRQGEEFTQPPEWHEHSGAEGSGEDEFHFGGTTGFSDFFEALFGMGGGSASGRRRAAADEAFAQRGRDVEADILVGLEEALRGGTRAISVRRAEPCERCGGSGRAGDRPCPECAGSGHVERTETYNVKIPAGVREGQRLRLGGRGERGAWSGHSGDLFLRVRYASHPDYRVEQGDLYYDLELPPWDAVLGATVSVPLLDGRASLKVPPGTLSGQRLRLRGMGLPESSGARGDLFVVVRLQLPERTSERERALWEELRRASSEGSRG